jgi:hypothetical protein
MEKFKDFTRSHYPLIFVLSLVVCFLSYSGNVMLPAFNPDDIAQIMPDSDSWATFIAQGRWGYFLVFSVLLESNPAGPIALFFGCALLFGSGIIAAKSIGLKEKAWQILFGLVASISIYYGELFVYDSSWIAYPIGIFCATFGAVMTRKSRFATAILALSLAPAFYQPAIQVAATLLLASALVMLVEKGAAATVRSLVVYAFVMLISLFLYLLSAKLFSLASGIPLVARTSIDIVGALSAYPRLLSLFWSNSIPFLAGLNDPYISQVWRLIAGCLFLGFVVTVALYRRYTLAEAAMVMVLVLALLVSPYCLAFASPLDEFSPRSMISFGIVYATMTCLPLKLLAQGAFGKKARWSSTGVVAAGFLFVAVNAIQSSKYSFDNYLASQQDLLATSRIIARLDEVMAQTELANQKTIQIAVKSSGLPQSGPRGSVWTNRYNDWSKEWIFHLVDRRLVPVSHEKRDAVLARASAKPAWPSRGSVYVDGNVVVVVLD